MRLALAIFLSIIVLFPHFSHAQSAALCNGLTSHTSKDGAVTLRLPGQWYMTTPSYDPNGHLMVGLLKGSERGQGSYSNAQASIVAVYQYDSHYDSFDEFVEGHKQNSRVVASEGLVTYVHAPHFGFHDHWLGGEHGQVLRISYRGKKLATEEVEQVFSCYTINRQPTIRGDLSVSGSNYVDYVNERGDYRIGHSDKLSATLMRAEDADGNGLNKFGPKHKVVFTMPGLPAMYQIRFYEQIADAQETYESVNNIPTPFASLIGDEVYGGRTYSSVKTPFKYTLNVERQYHVLFLRYGAIWGKTDIGSSGTVMVGAGQPGMVGPLNYYKHMVRMMQETENISLVYPQSDSEEATETKEFTLHNSTYTLTTSYNNNEHRMVVHQVRDDWTDYGVASMYVGTDTQPTMRLYVVSNKYCLYSWCEYDPYATFQSTSGRTWEYLGTATYVDAGTTNVFDYIYRYEFAGYVVYVVTENPIHGSETSQGTVVAESRDDAPIDFGRLQPATDLERTFDEIDLAVKG